MCNGEGGSQNIHLDRAAAAVHLLMARLRVRAWFEFIKSEANWADGLSRKLERDLWPAVAVWTLPWQQLLELTLGAGAA